MVLYLLWKWEVLTGEERSLRRKVIPMVWAAKELSVRLGETGSFE